MSEEAQKRHVILKIAGFCGVASPVVSWTFIALSIIMMPEFDWIKNWLSDLGCVETTAVIFNSGLIISGVLGVAFAFGFYEIQKTKLGRLGVYVYMLGAISLCAIGVFLKTFGMVHFVASVAFFALTSISMVMVGVAEIAENKVYGVFTLVSGLVAGVAALTPWKALSETISGITMSVWTIISAGKLLRREN